MDQIIEYVMGNSWMILILIGIISSVFSRFGKKESESTTPIPIPKPLRPFFEEEIEKPKEATKQLHEPNTTHVEEVTVIENTNNLYQKYLELQDKNSVENSQVREDTSQVISESLVSKRQTNKRISKNKVAEGIIWSEVLGPPRSKKPFQRRNNRI
ncbi:hypothetical protein [Fredinandcohnia quinoae]|uniref:ATP synthase F0 subunit 8 n=1 Tax=Fredinandcohnia quinoae TaxID=2918902 RepID=A0AAW5E122_9BACI|nr:hypothetical protein [Fredinandcohnia sp. SECRCQ15]MCH1624980.1 hypothetical protein [Fredinandcohnia sp. SECRCQ15]